MLRSLARLLRCHEVLGVSPQASREELKLRYRELARRFHPDRLGDVAVGEANGACAKFAALSEAFAACLQQVPKVQPTTGAEVSAKSWPTSWPPERPRPWLRRTAVFPASAFQGQPWKWRIRGPLTISAKRKFVGIRR